MFCLTNWAIKLHGSSLFPLLRNDLTLQLAPDSFPPFPSVSCFIFYLLMEGKFYPRWPLPVSSEPGTSQPPTMYLLNKQRRVRWLWYCGSSSFSDKLLTSHSPPEDNKTEIKSIAGKFLAEDLEFSVTLVVHQVGNCTEQALLIYLLVKCRVLMTSSPPLRRINFLGWFIMLISLLGWGLFPKPL